MFSAVPFILRGGRFINENNTSFTKWHRYHIMTIQFQGYPANSAMVYLLKFHVCFHQFLIITKTFRGSRILRIRAFFHKTVRVCHVYCNFKIGFTGRIIVIFGTLKDGSLLINTLASNICFSYRNICQNGVDALPKIVDAFLSKSSNFHLVRIIR